MQDQIFGILLKEDEITWQNLLFELVRQENMDPWDIDISSITHRFIEMLKAMQSLNLKITGKVVLASALLLRFKSTHFLGEDIAFFDRLMAPPEDVLSDDDFAPESGARPAEKWDGNQLYPRMPQQRKRKVSIYDLVEALQQAMKVNQRRVQRQNYEIEIPVPGRKVDITEKIEEVYRMVSEHYDAQGSDTLTFSQLVPQWEREAVVYTFLPLLHLSNERKVDLSQQEHFGEIEIRKLKAQPKKDINDAAGEAD